MKYECENCGAFYSDEDITEEGEMREDCYGVRFWATFHYCPCCGEEVITDEDYEDTETIEDINYINTDDTGTMISSEAVKPIEATKNNVLFTDKDVQIRDGQKVLASYGETIDIGGESEQHVTIAKDKMAVNAGPESLFSVDSFKSGTEIISTWINTDKLTPTEDIYPEISDSIAFSVKDINDTIDLDGSYRYSYNYSFYNKGAKRVWFELEGGGTITINEAVSGNSLHYEEFSDSGNDYYNGFILATSEKITRTDIIALRAAYDIEFNPAIVDISLNTSSMEKESELSGSFFMLQLQAIQHIQRSYSRSPERC